MAQSIADIAKSHERNRPDVIVHDYVSVAGRILAKQWGIPTIQASCDFKLDKRYPSRQAPDLIKHVSYFEPQLKSFLERYDVVDEVLYFHRAKLNIYFYPNIFQLDGNTLDESCFYAGRCAPERPYSDKWRPKDTDNRPTVLVSTSSLYVKGPDYFKMCIDALADLQWHVILQIGENNSAYCFDTLPPHFEIIQHKPQIAILPYVHLLICAGGMMSTMDAMYCGVPLLMMTHGHVELEAYADNNVRLGLGRHLKKTDSNVEAIRTSVLQMSEDISLGLRVKQMQRLVRASPGGEEVANRIGEYIECLM